MNRSDHLDLDGHALQLLLAVFEEGSVTRAALRLDMTQSAVSHGLDRLRAIVGDPLFVKSGRGIAATAQAALLAQRARHLLDELRAFSLAAGFDAARLDATITVAANDLQRDLLVPAWLRRLRAEAPGLKLQLIDSNAPQPVLLREQHCQLVITPRPPDGADIVHKRLFEDRYCIFHDPAQCPAPATRAEYAAAEHVSVRYANGRALDIDEWLVAHGVQRPIVATVPGLGALAALLHGGPWLATAPSLMARGALRGLATAPLPLKTPVLPMYLVWHQRHQADPVHRWLRGHLEAVVKAGAASRI